MFRSTLITLVVLTGAALTTAQTLPNAAPQSPGKIRTYYVAADEVEWDYAPGGVNKMMGMKFDGYPNVFVERGPHRIGSVYHKAIYREYTDETFTQLKPRPAEWESNGLLGPVLRAEVGDTIRIVFKNNATKPYSMHPHGVFYKKDSEGALYEDGTPATDKIGDAVPPGKTHVYVWEVPERAGPGPNDPSSVVWLYHSHASEMKDVETGLVGAIIVSRRGVSDASGKPKDVDREFICLFMMFDENQSWYLDHNIQAYAGDPKGVNKGEFLPTQADGTLAPVGTGFAAANLKLSINGYIYGTGPMMVMKKGEHVRWYLLALGEVFSFHSPHWHGNVVMDNGHRTDVVSLVPAQMLTVDMIPDDPGTWMFHCHIDDHMESGMMTMYKVEP